MRTNVSDFRLMSLNGLTHDRMVHRDEGYVGADVAFDHFTSQIGLPTLRPVQCRIDGEVLR
jgi:hypothetical protein